MCIEYIYDISASYIYHLSSPLPGALLRGERAIAELQRAEAACARRWAAMSQEPEPGDVVGGPALKGGKSLAKGRSVIMFDYHAYDCHDDVRRFNSMLCELIEFGMFGTLNTLVVCKQWCFAPMSSQKNKWSCRLFGGEHDEPIGVSGALPLAGKSYFDKLESFLWCQNMSSLIRLFVVWARAQGKPNDNYRPSYFGFKPVFGVRCSRTKSAEGEMGETMHATFVNRPRMN